MPQSVLQRHIEDICQCLRLDGKDASLLVVAVAPVVLVSFCVSFLHLFRLTWEVLGSFDNLGALCAPSGAPDHTDGQ